MVYAFIYGAILTFGLIIPLGVQNIFLFNQGATQRHFIHAMPSVIMASLCDSTLIISAVLGVSVAVMAISWLKTVILVVGFVFLMYMGWVTWQNSQSAKLTEKNSKPLSAKRQIVFAASVSLLNPHAMIDTVGVIGTNSLHFVGKEKIVFTAACIVITVFWFFGLSVAGHFLHRLDKTGVWLKTVNKISALIIWTVAFYIAWTLLNL